MATVQTFNRYGRSMSKYFATDLVADCVAESAVMSPNASETAVRVVVVRADGTAYARTPGGGLTEPACATCGIRSDVDFKDGRICVDCFEGDEG